METQILTIFIKLENAFDYVNRKKWKIRAQTNRLDSQNFCTTRILPGLDIIKNEWIILKKLDNKIGTSWNTVNSLKE